jgi:hypothetical protein
MTHLAVAGALALALSACDTTPPTFTVRPHAGFAVGTQLGTSDLTNDDHEDDFTTPVYRHLYWGATDAPGCEIHYDVERVFAGSEPELILENSTVTDLVAWHQDYNGDYGGGSFQIMHWNVIAHDCSGNTKVAEVPAPDSPAPTTVVWQETGQNGEWGVVDEPHPVGWTGTWRTSRGAWASGAEMEYTTQAGASVSFEHQFAADQHIGLVMSKGPGRGSADVYVDDVKVGTVDTFAPANDNRRIVFDHKMTAGTHTVEVVNLATPGHPRIDIDAFLT